MISFTNLSILAEESRYFQHVLRIISGIFSWGNNMFSLYQKVTFIKIRQTNPSAPIFFSANAKRASSVEDIIALCLSTGSISQMASGVVLRNKTTRKWRDFTVM